MANGPESVGQGGGGVNPFGGVNNDKLNAALERMKAFNKTADSAKLTNYLNGKDKHSIALNSSNGQPSLNPGMTGDTSKYGSIFPNKNFT